MFVLVNLRRQQPSFLHDFLNSDDNFFNSFTQGYRSNQFHVFDSPFNARRYVRQNPFENFLSFAFAQQANRVMRDMNSFFHHLTHVSYFAPRMVERPIRFRPAPRFINIYDEDRDFLRGLSFNQPVSVPRRPTRPSLANADSIPAGKLAPNAKLPSTLTYNSEGLVDSVLMDTSKDLVCVKTAEDRNKNPMYQVYDRKTLFEVYQRNRLQDGSFKDPNTNQFVKIKDVFRISYNEFTNHMRQQTSNANAANLPEPAASNVSSRMMRRN